MKKTKPIKVLKNKPPKHSDDSPTTERGNGWLGVALIMLGLSTGIIMGMVLL